MVVGEIDIAAGIQPLCRVRGRVWIGLAGVKVSGSKYEIFSAHVELGGRFRRCVHWSSSGEARFASLVMGNCFYLGYDFHHSAIQRRREMVVLGDRPSVGLTPEQGAPDADRFTPDQY